MKLEEFKTKPFVRRPFDVMVAEITQDNIADLAEHVGELKDKDGTPFIQSDKKKVGNNFKVWPGFYATILKGKVRCYSRKTFFEQFVGLDERTKPAIDFLHGRITLDQLMASGSEDTVGEEEGNSDVPVEIPVESPIELPDEPSAPVEALPSCEHGTPEGTECAYKKCEGVSTEEDDGVPDDAYDANGGVADVEEQEVEDEPLTEEPETTNPETGPTAEGLKSVFSD